MTFKKGQIIRNENFWVDLHNNGLKIAWKKRFLYIAHYEKYSLFYRTCESFSFLHSVLFPKVIIVNSGTENGGYRYVGNIVMLMMLQLVTILECATTVTNILKLASILFISNIRH